MSRRHRADPRRIKIHRSYTVEQLAQLLDCHKNSVRSWLKQGLEPLDDGKRPLLIQGREARRFLETKRQSKKRRCRPHELYCLHCRDARLPAARQAEYWRAPGQAGLLTAECAECGTQMFKRVSERSLPKLQELLDLKVQEAEETPKLAA
jgi:hypothetical protein